MIICALFKHELMHISALVLYHKCYQNSYW